VRWALIGAAVVVVFAGVAILTTSGDEIGKLPPPERGALGARVDWSEPDEGDPRAVVMLVHGGGWQPSPTEFESQRTLAAPLNKEGYATVAIGYDEGEQGYRQIEAVYAEARERYPRLPICALGTSAGANLSLVLATREPELDCVIGMATPTDLTTLPEQGAEDAYEAAVTAFGRDQLEAFSPALHADEIQAEVLLIAAESDPTAPADQSREFEDVFPEADVLIYPPGDVPVFWAHFGGVEPGANEEVAERELAFLDEATEG
jgi:dipeptidyl aminopeptidase/acylaminoacyl peptidase